MVKKILMTTDTVGGVWIYSLELCRAMAPFGIRIALATMGQPMSSAQQQEARSLHNVSVHESAFRLEWMDHPWEDTAKAGEWLLKLRDRFQPDVVHLNGYVHAALPWELPVLVVGHSCVCSWWRAVNGELPPQHWNRYRAEVTRGLQAATKVVAPSKTMLSNLETLYGPLQSAAVVPNGRDPQHFRVARKSPLVLAAGRIWDPAKNISALADIAGELSWPICIAGENRFEKNELDVSSKHGRLRYLGQLPFAELADWMAQASIFVLPARYEPFGLTVLEAAFSGCALVLGDIPSLRENWDGAAAFVDVDDRGQLKRGHAQAIRDPQHLKEFGNRARERAQQFTADRMAGGYIETYQALCDSFSSITL